MLSTAISLWFQLADAEVVLSVTAIPESPAELAVGLGVLHEARTGAPVIAINQPPVHGVRAFELAKVVGEGAVRVLLALGKPDVVRQQGVVDQLAVAGNVRAEELLALCHRGSVTLLDALSVSVADRGNTPAVVRVSISLLSVLIGLPQPFVALNETDARRRRSDDEHGSTGEFPVLGH